MRKLFGTDGIRGLAGKSPLTSREIFYLGKAAGTVLNQHFPGQKSKIVIVRDTRASGQKILRSLEEGLRSTGVDVFDGGVMNTPSVSYIVQTHRFQSGAVISASHNPAEFNGIKFFTAHGVKWPDVWEEKVEDLFFKSVIARSPPRRATKQSHYVIASPSSRARNDKQTGILIEAPSLTDDYEDFLIETLDGQAYLTGLKVAVDCANGANYLIAPQVLKRLGAETVLISHHPDGKNINFNCGSLHTRKLARVVRSNRCDAGIAFDGDGDRVIFIDEKGQERDGDFLIALLAKVLKLKKELKGNLVVITVMANLGLKKALRKFGIRAFVTPVGDRHVALAMKKYGSVLGGEQSGHIILGRHLSTGDGLLTAIHVLSVLRESGLPLSKLVGWVKKYPQVLLNVPVQEKKPLESLNGASRKIEQVKKTLGDNGRVFVRYSGTEPLLRVMLEGPDQKKLAEYAQDIADAILAEF